MSFENPGNPVESLADSFLRSQTELQRMNAQGESEVARVQKVVEWSERALAEVGPNPGEQIDVNLKVVQLKFAGGFLKAAYEDLGDVLYMLQQTPPELVSEEIRSTAVELDRSLAGLLDARSAESEK